MYPNCAKDDHNTELLRMDIHLPPGGRQGRGAEKCMVDMSRGPGEKFKSYFIRNF